MTGRVRTGLVATVLGLACGCSGQRASAEDCARLADRIVALELQEQGYRDPVLLQRKQQSIKGALGAELQRCEGRRLVPGALECAARARSTEELSHQCLR